MKFKTKQKISSVLLCAGLIISSLLLMSCGQDLSSSDRITQARSLMSSEKYKAAVIQLKKALQNEPANKDARYLLGVIYIELGDGPSAEKELRRAEKLGVKNPLMVIYMGKAFLLQKKYKEALDVLQIASVEVDKDKSFVLSMRGNVYFQRAEFDQAEQAYMGALSLYSKNYDAYIGRAKIALKKNHYNKVENYLKRALDIKPDEKKILLVEGQMYRQRSEYLKAEKVFLRVLGVSRKIVTELQFKAVVSLINVQMIQEKLDDAGRNIDVLSKTLPRHPYPKYLRAWLAYQRENYTQANTLLLELQKKIPNHMPSLLLLGASNYALGNYEQANVYLTRFVNNMPTHIQGRKLLGAVRLMQNQPQEAMDILRPVLEGKDVDAGLLSMAGMAAASLGERDIQLHYLKKAIKLDPKNVSLRAELARAYMKRGEFDDAIAILEPIEKGKNKALDARLLIVYAYIRSGKYKKAKSLVEQTIQGAGKTPKLYTLMGVIELYDGQREAARNNFNAALTIDAGFILAHLNLARMALENGDLSRASKIFDRVLLVNDKSVEAMVGHAQIAEQRGEGEKVILWLERARKADNKTLVPRIILARYYLSVRQPDVAMKIAEEIFTIAPDKFGSFVLLGRSQIYSGNVKLALITFEKLVKQIPKNAYGFVELANARFIAEQEKEGRAALNQALKIDPALVSAKMGLIRLELRLKNFGPAMRLVKELKQSRRNSNIGYILEGDVYSLQDKFKQATSAYRQALKIQSSVELTLKLAQTYSSAGKQRQSLRTLLLASKKYPEDLRLKTAIGAYYQKAANMTMAEKYYKQVLKQQPSNLMVLNNLAILFSENNTAQAIKYAQLAYQQAPANDAIADTLGWLLLQNGELEKSLTMLEGVANRNKNPIIQYHYAAALEKVGRLSVAAEVLNRALSSSANFPEREQAKNLLQQLKK